MRSSAISMLAGAAFSLAAGSVAAAAPLFAPTYNWSGFYVGGNIGHAFSTIDTDATLNGIGAPSHFGPFSFAHSDQLKFRGTLGGAQIGFNWQASPNWVWGVEADWQASDQKGSVSYSDAYAQSRPGLTSAGSAATSYNTKLSWFGTLRGRVGFAWDRLLVYATAGFAYGQVTLAGVTEDNGYTQTSGLLAPPRPFGAAAGFSTSKVNTGWTAGAGVEGALVNTWSWKAEYLYLDLGSLDLSAPGPFAPATISAHARFIDNIVRVGVNHKFGG